MIILMTVIITVTMGQDYCEISSKHTLCNHQVPGPSCNGKHIGRGVTKQEIQEILDVHNRLRAIISRGEETRGSPGPQPSAADMREMIWDEELSRVAQGHADQCKFAHDCSDCRKVSRFGVGQNLYIYKQSLRQGATDWGRAVKDWYDEVSLFSNKHVKPFQFSSATGHYSQVVWANTDKVGCGATSYRDGKWFATLYTCNYGPNGNFIRQQMYKSGPACSSCPRGTSCSTNYPGLCSAGNLTVSDIPDKSLSPVSNTLEESFGSKTVKQPTFKSIFRNKSTVTVKEEKNKQKNTSLTPRKQTKTTTTVPVTTNKQTTLQEKTTSKQPDNLKSRERTTTKPISTTRFEITKLITIITTTPTVRKTTTTRQPTTTKTTVVNNRFIPPTTIRQPTTAVRSSFTTRTEPTTVKSALRENNLFSCKFEDDDKYCKIRSNYKLWESRNLFDNNYNMIELNNGEKSEFFFEKLITPPIDGIACLDFRYKKFSTAGTENKVTVIAWPRKGRPGTVKISQDSPDEFTWVRAQITFRNVNKEFLIMFQARGSQTQGDVLLVALDDIIVTSGRCVPV